jgi:hypothetical protein
MGFEFAGTPPPGDGHYPAAVSYYLAGSMFFPILIFVTILAALYVVIRAAVRAGIEDAWRRRQDRNDEIEG